MMAEGDVGTWSHCGSREPHPMHKHDVVMNEGRYPDVQCNGTPNLDSSTVQPEDSEVNRILAHIHTKQMAEKPKPEVVNPGITPRHYCSVALMGLDPNDQAVVRCTCGKFYRYNAYDTDEEGRWVSSWSRVANANGNELTRLKRSEYQSELGALGLRVYCRVCQKRGFAHSHLVFKEDGW